METRRLTCPSCGGPLPVPSGVDVLTCSYCSARLSVTWDGPQAELKVAEQLGKAIEVSGSATQDAIRDGASTTLLELRRLQLAQDLSLAQLQLANVQAEMRSLERQKRDRAAKRQLKDLASQQASLKERILTIQAALAARPVTPAHDQPQTAPSPAAPKPPTVLPAAQPYSPPTHQQPQYAPPPPAPKAPKPPKAPRAPRRPLSPMTLILIGVPLFVSGGLCFLLTLLAQLSAEAGPTDNLTGFAGVVLLCPAPLGAIGAILTGIGLYLHRRASATKEKPPESPIPPHDQ